MSLTSDTAGSLTGLQFPRLCCFGLRAAPLPLLCSCPPHGIFTHRPCCSGLTEKQALFWEISPGISFKINFLNAVEKCGSGLLHKLEDLAANINSLPHILLSSPAGMLTLHFSTSVLEVQPTHFYFPVMCIVCALKCTLTECSHVLAAYEAAKLQTTANTMQGTILFDPGVTLWLLVATVVFIATAKAEHMFQHC